MFDLDSISNIKGYSTLATNQEEIFEKFMPIFFMGWGNDARETIIPKSVEYIKNAEGKYLKFTYEMYGRKEWLHVTSPYNYY